MGTITMLIISILLFCAAITLILEGFTAIAIACLALGFASLAVALALIS